MLKLTDRFIDAAKVPDGSTRLELRDAEVRGLELRVTLQGAKTWAYSYWQADHIRAGGGVGGRKRVTLGQYPTVTLKEARGRALALKIEVQQGGDPAAGVSAKKVEQTFRELSEQWIADYADHEKGARTLADDKSMLRVHVWPQIGAKLVTEIGVRDLAAMLNKVKRAKDARYTVEPGDAPAKPMSVRANRVFELVRSILWWAEGQGIIANNPAKAMQPPTKKAGETVRDRTLNPDEMRRVWQALQDTPVTPRRSKRRAEGTLTMTRPLALAMQLSLVTGQRIGETSGIARAELDLNDLAPMWVIPKERAKNGRAHRVPLSIEAVAVLREALKLSGESAFLFPARGRIRTLEIDGKPIKQLVEEDCPITAAGVTRAWGRSRAALGLEDVNVHDLRRTALTGLAETGTPPLMISLVANHASATHGSVTMKTYIKHPYDREKRVALDAWGALLGRILAGNEAANVVELSRLQ